MTRMSIAASLSPSNRSGPIGPVLWPSRPRRDSRETGASTWRTRSSEAVRSISVRRKWLAQYVTISYKSVRSQAGRRRMTVNDDFFSDVTGPIAFGGLDSTDPLSFKVYQPDRVVLGRRGGGHPRGAGCPWARL